MPGRRRCRLAVSNTGTASSASSCRGPRPGPRRRPPAQRTGNPARYSHRGRGGFLAIGPAAAGDVRPAGPSCATVQWSRRGDAAPLKSCRNTVANVSTANCGQHASRPIATSRATRGHRATISRTAESRPARGLRDRRGAGAGRSTTAQPEPRNGAPVGRVVNAQSSCATIPASTARLPHRPASRPNTAPKPARDAAMRAAQRAQAAAQGHGSLADAHRQAAFAFVEPCHHRAAAGAVDLAPSRHQQQASASSHKAGTTPWSPERRTGSHPGQRRCGRARPASSTSRSPQRSPSPWSRSSRARRPGRAARRQADVVVRPVVGAQEDGGGGQAGRRAGERDIGDHPHRQHLPAVGGARGRRWDGKHGGGQGHGEGSGGLTRQSLRHADIIREIARRPTGQGFEKRIVEPVTLRWTCCAASSRGRTGQLQPRGGHLRRSTSAVSARS